MVNKTWALALYNVKKTYSNLEDLQNMLDKAEEIDNAYYSRTDIIKEWLFNNNLLTDVNIEKLVVEQSLVSLLLKIDSFMASYTPNFNHNYLGDVIECIINSDGKFIVNLDDKTVDYRMDDDKQFDVNAFLETIDDLKKEVSMKSVLNFIYKNGFQNVKYENITGNKTAYDNIAVVIPILECLNDPNLAMKFSNYQLAEFFNAFIGTGRSGNDKDVSYLKELVSFNNEYVKLDNTIVAKYENAMKVLVDDFNVQKDLLVNKVDEMLTVVELNTISDELFKLYKGNGITFKYLIECYTDFISSESGYASKFATIKNNDHKNKIVEILKSLVYDIIIKYINFITKTSNDVIEYDNNVKIMRVKVAGDRLMMGVIEKWQSFINAMKNNPAFATKVSELEDDFKEMYVNYNDDDFKCEYIKPNISYIDLILKIDTFEKHFFDSVIDFMKDEVKNTPKQSIETKLACEKEVLHIMSVLFNVPFDAKSEYKTYSQSALIVYGFVKN